MRLTEDEIFQNYGEQCKHCLLNNFLPDEIDFSCISCGYNVF